MFTREDLVRIGNLPEEGNTVISVYLNVNPVINPRGDYFLAFKNLAKEEMDKLDNAQQKEIKEDIKKIEVYLKSGRTEFKKGLAIISSSSINLWEVFHLSVPFKNQVVIDKSPYLKPLVNLLEKFNSYVVALVDREHARLFNIYMGEIYEYTALFTPDIPGKHKKGGFYGRDENRFRRHIDVHVYFHLKDVAKHLEEMLEKGEINYLITGGTEESIHLFKKILSPSIADRIIGTFHAEMFAGNSDILEQSLKIIKNVERKEEEKLVDELLTRVSKNGSAAIGLEDVLMEIQSGNVHNLIYIEGFMASGFKCSECHFLTIQDLGTCPYCERPLERVDHLTDHAIQKAIDQGAIISSISKNEKLEKAGSIGALLRY